MFMGLEQYWYFGRIFYSLVLLFLLLLFYKRMNDWRGRNYIIPFIPFSCSCAQSDTHIIFHSKFITTKSPIGLMSCCFVHEFYPPQKNRHCFASFPFCFRCSSRHSNVKWMKRMKWMEIGKWLTYAVVISRHLKIGFLHVAEHAHNFAWPRKKSQYRSCCIFGCAQLSTYFAKLNRRIQNVCEPQTWKIIRFGSTIKAPFS